MRTPLISWKPPTLAAAADLVSAMRFYVGERQTNFRLYANGTVLLIKEDGDTEANANRCLDELLFIPDFRVVEMKNGNFMVSPHEVGAILVLKTEIAEQLAGLRENEEEAKLPGEVFLRADHNLPIGLVGRAKLWKDAQEKVEVHHHVWRNAV
jgi:hypothetical protein